MGKKKIMMLVLSLFFVLGLTNVSLSKDFPEKPIRLIVCYPPGGGTDILARGFQRALEKELGGKVLVENIPGGNTKVGTMEVMKAKPDGYTLIFASNESWIGFYYTKTYDIKVWEKLTPVGNIATDPYIIIEVRAESPYKKWADLAKAAKETPGKLTCGMIGVGGIRELAMDEMAKVVGTEWKYVPFAGAAPSSTALLGGHIDFRIVTPGEAVAMIRAGKTRGLAVSTDERMKALPDIPSFRELGIGESLMLTRAIWGPPNLPRNIVNITTKAIEKAIKDPEFVNLLENQLLCEVKYISPDRIQEGLKAWEKRYGPRLADLGNK